MGRHYSTRELFRQMPNALLARYFEVRGQLGHLDFGTMNETRPDELFAAWLELPDAERNRMDAELREIFELSCEKGFHAIRDEAEWHLSEEPDAFAEFVEKLASLPNHFERAMVTFLDHHQFWSGGRHFYHADMLPWWRKRKNLPRVPAAVDEASRAELANLIRDYFHRTEGRGKNCLVEVLRRGELDYFFAYPEDFSQHAIEWVNGQFGRRPHNPAFEVVYVYSREEGSLDVNCRGSHKAIEPLQRMFAMAILKLPALPVDAKDQRVYDLNPLRDRNFNFVPALGSGIEDVAVKKLRLSSTIKKGERITVEADPANGSVGLYDLLDQMRRGIPLDLYHVTQVELVASVVVDSNKPAKNFAIQITYPNSCSLKYDAIDLKLRDMLTASGIEPKEPFEAAEAAHTAEA